MPKNNQPQPPASEDAKTYNCEITIQDKWIKAIHQAAPGDFPVASKVEALAQGFFTDMLLGAIMMSPIEVKKMEETIGKEVFPSDIMEQFQRGVGRREGRLEFTIALDPADEGPVQAAAEFQGCTIKDVLQKCWQEAWYQGEFYNRSNFSQHVAMTHEDKKELAAILGKDFSNGTELAGLVKAYAADHEGLFEEITK